eukprot:s462_g41.t1
MASEARSPLESTESSYKNHTGYLCTGWKHRKPRLPRVLNVAQVDWARRERQELGRTSECQEDRSLGMARFADKSMTTCRMFSLRVLVVGQCAACIDVLNVNGVNGVASQAAKQCGSKSRGESVLLLPLNAGMQLLPATDVDGIVFDLVISCHGVSGDVINTAGDPNSPRQTCHGRMTCLAETASRALSSQPIGLHGPSLPCETTSDIRRDRCDRCVVDDSWRPVTWDDLGEELQMEMQ